MKITKKITLALLTCIAFSHVAMHCFSNDGNNMWRGAAIGGLAGGQNGLYAGMAAGAVMDMGSQSRRRSRYDDDRYYDKKRNQQDTNKHSRRKLERQNEELQRKNEDLEARISALENQN